MYRLNLTVTSTVEGCPATSPFYYFIPPFWSLTLHVITVILLPLCHFLYKHPCFVIASTFEQPFIL